MIKRRIHWILSILQLVFLIAAYALHYYAEHRMGMMRYLVFLNGEWEQKYPIATLQVATIVIFLLLTMLLVGLSIKHRKNLSRLNIAGRITSFGQLILTGGFVIFTLSYTKDSMLSYYLIDLILAIIVLIQNLKLLLLRKK